MSATETPYNPSLPTFKDSYTTALELLSDLLADDGERGRENEGPLEGAQLPWRRWLEYYFPSVCRYPVTERHTRLWDWFDSLTPGIKPQPEVHVWPRGGGKSTSGEVGCVRVCVKLSRRFVLFVSETQTQANMHVQSVGAFLESVGVERAVNKYGNSRGWTQERLRTANGFNIAAYGLDAAARGIKLDEFRPDLIIFDDIDSQEDTPNSIDKKVRSITKSIIPAGSSDCAILFLQNKIHENGIVSQLVDGRADFLHNRRVPTVEPAVRGLKTKLESQPDGTYRYRITSGEATWEGQSLSTCEEQINEWGLEAFLQEAQHEVANAHGVFFKEWNPALHIVDYAEHAGNRYSLEEMLELPSSWWTRIAAMDWGYNHPTVFLWGCVSPDGIVYVYREHWVRGKNVHGDDGLLDRYKSYPDSPGMIGAGPDVFTMAKERIGGPNIAQQFRSGYERPDGEKVAGVGMLNPTQGKKRRHQWQQVRRYLQWSDGDGGVIAGRPLLRIFRGTCPHLEAQIPKMIFDATNDPEDMLKQDINVKGQGGDDAVDALAHLLMQRPYIGTPPEAPPAPYLSIDAVDEERAEKRRQQRRSKT